MLLQERPLVASRAQVRSHRITNAALEEPLVADSQSIARRARSYKQP